MTCKHILFDLILDWISFGYSSGTAIVYEYLLKVMHLMSLLILKEKWTFARCTFCDLISIADIQKLDTQIH